MIVPIPHHNHAFVAFVKLLRLCWLNNMGDSKPMKFVVRIRAGSTAAALSDDQKIRPAVAYALLLFAWRTRQFISLPTHKVSGCLGTPKWLQS
jgi:hypothetical protein